MAHPPRQSRDGVPALGGRVLGEFTASHGGGDADPARGPAVPTGPPVMAPGEAVWAVVCATLVRDTQAMLPDPDEEPTPEDDDEPEDEPQDKPDDESEDKPDDEPGTLYFGQGDGWTARSC